MKENKYGETWGEDRRAKEKETPNIIKKSLPILTIWI